MSDNPNPYESPQHEQPLAEDEAEINISPALRVVGLGLNMVYFGIVLILFTMVFAAVLPLFSLTVAPVHHSSDLTYSPLLAFCLVFSLFIGSILMLIGPMLCLVVPVESKARLVVILSVAFQFISLLLFIGCVAFLRGHPLLFFVYFTSVAAGVLSEILFIYFLLQLSRYLGKIAFAKRAKRVIIASLALILVIVCCVVNMLFNLVPGIVGVITVLCAFLWGIILFLKYANLINDIRKYLRKKPTAANPA